MATRNIPAPSNPYASGAVVFDSTPYTEFYIREQQKEQAKDEALDKYFQEWDKSINPAGMRNVDTQDFLNLINENKDFYFKNKAAIKNPALDGGRAYNEWSSRGKSAMGLVAQSKDLAGKEDLINKSIIAAKQKGLPITDRVVLDLERFRQPIKSKNWRDFNPDNLDFQPKPFDPTRFTKDIFGDIKFSTKLVSETKLPETKQIKKVMEEVMPDEALPLIKSRAAAAYTTSPSVKEYVDASMQDPMKFQKLNSLYSSRFKRNIESAEDMAAAVALSFSPVGTKKDVIIDDKEALMKLRDAYIKGRQKSRGGAGSTFDFLKKATEIAQTGNSSLLNDYLSVWKAGEKTGLKGDKIGFKSAEITPNGQIKITYSTPLKGGVQGKMQTDILDAKDPQLLNKLTGLHQLFLGSDIKAEKEAQEEAIAAATNASQKPKKEVKETKTFTFPNGKTKF